MQYWESSDNRRRPYYSFEVGSRYPVVKGLIIATVAVYFIEKLLMAFSGYGGDLLGIFGLSRGGVFGRGFIWQLVTYAFLHDPGDLFHILFNMLFLYWFGREIEQTWGSKRFLVFYVTAAAFSGLLFIGADVLLSPQLTSLCIGASGAIMAALMVYAIWWPDRTILFMLFFPMRIRTFVLIIIGIEFIGLMSVSRSNGVANMAHLGGLLYGYLVLRAGPLLQRAAARLPRSAPRDNAADQRRLDELLDKVHRQGIQSLSWWEKRFLRKMSSRR